MATRIALIISATFWLTMNFLLWRSEYGAGKGGGAPVPTELVWKKIITAPDNSSLTIYHGRRKLGYCRWTVSTGSSPAASASGDQPGPEVLESANNGYRLELDGNVTIPGEKERYQVECEMRLTTNQDWQDLRLRMATHEASATLKASAREEAVELSGEDGATRYQEKFSFAELQNPAGLAKALGAPLPFLPGLPGLGGAATNRGLLKALAPSLNWEARNERLMIGHAGVEVYRLRARILDKYEAVVYVSRVGEILKLELPEGWVLVNDDAGVRPEDK